MAAILIFLKNLPRGQHERMHGAIVVTSASANESRPNGQVAEFQGPDGSMSTKLIFPPAVPHSEWNFTGSADQLSKNDIPWRAFYLIRIGLLHCRIRETWMVLGDSQAETEIH